MAGSFYGAGSTLAGCLNFGVHLKESSQSGSAISKHNISPDSPLIDPASDLLGHAPFAKALATSISRMPPADGLVIALHGPWGSGKTTILNFVEQYLKQESEITRPIIVKFAPWWFSGQHDLTERFFDQLAGHLKEDGGVSGETLERIADFTEAISEFPIPILSQVLKGGGKILCAVRQKNLTKLKEEIESSLRALGRKIVVVIDDIDRLTAEEIRQMFGVVKSVANFPNTIYLLAFDRDVAERALEPLQNVQKGKEYLEKIVQVSCNTVHLRNKAMLSLEHLSGASRREDRRGENTSKSERRGAS
jgi:predicted KAP-like P-loop ATPase